jgi:hypothetical protein
MKTRISLLSLAILGASLFAGSLSASERALSPKLRQQLHESRRVAVIEQDRLARDFWTAPPKIRQQRTEARRSAVLTIDRIPRGIARTSQRALMNQLPAAHPWIERRSR